MSKQVRNDPSTEAEPQAARDEGRDPGETRNMAIPPAIPSVSAGQARTSPPATPPPAIPPKITPTQSPPQTPVSGPPDLKVNRHVVKRKTAQGTDGPPSKLSRAETPPPFGALVGREGELKLLQETIARALEFQAPQFVTVIGSRGTGKTRLIAQLIHTLEQPTIRVFWGRAVAAGPRYEAIGSLLRDRFCWDDTDREASIRSVQSELIRLFSDTRVSEILYVLAGFLGVDCPSSPFLQVIGEIPTKYDAIARTVLRRFVEVDAAHSPLILVFDDLHWMDEDTMLLLKELAVGLSGTPVVIITCTRPELVVRRGDWAAEAVDYTRIDLGNLMPENAAEMLRALLPECRGLTPEAIDRAVGMTGGNPQIIQHLADLYRRNGTIRNESGVLHFDAKTAASTTLPISIEEAIDARIAGLEPLERQVLEAGAVLGNVFWLGAVCALHRLGRLDKGAKPEDNALSFPQQGETQYCWSEEDEPIRREICEVIEELVDRDYILQLDAEDSTIAGDVELVFKHNLERELILKSIEHGKLARFHQYAAQWLEMNLGGLSNEHYELLATLHERADHPNRAAKFYRSAANRARRRYANDEAIKLYDRALALYGGEDATARLEILHNLGDILDLTGEIEAATTKFADMLRLAWLFDNRDKAAWAHVRIGRMFRTQGQYGQAMQQLREANALFRASQDTAGVADSLDDIGSIHWLRGAYRGALDFHNQALALRRTLKNRRLIALSLANLGRVYFEIGQFEEAFSHCKEALEIRRETKDQRGIATSLCDMGNLFAYDGSWDIALPLFQEAHQTATKIGDRRTQVVALSCIGECQGMAGQEEEGAARLRKAAELAKGLTSRVLVSECCRRLANVYVQMENVESAQECARLALSIGESVGSKRLVGASHRVLGETLTIHVASSDNEQARQHFLLGEAALSESGSKPELARCYGATATFHELVGERNKALQYRRRAAEIRDELHRVVSSESS